VAQTKEVRGMKEAIASVPLMYKEEKRETEINIFTRKLEPSFHIPHCQLALVSNEGTKQKEQTLLIHYAVIAFS
jgi:hypothetical protein